MGNCLAAPNKGTHRSLPQTHKFSSKRYVSEATEQETEHDDSSTLPLALSPGASTLASDRLSPYAPVKLEESISRRSSPLVGSPSSPSVRRERGSRPGVEEQYSGYGSSNGNAAAFHSPSPSKSSPVRRNQQPKQPTIQSSPSLPSHHHYKRSVTDQASPAPAPPSRRSVVQHQQGREVQRRLDKARGLQTALKHSEARMALEATSLSSLSQTKSRNLDDTLVAYGGNNGFYYRYSLSSDSQSMATSTSRTAASAPAPATTMNSEFEASLEKGMIWADLETTDQVLAVALSRTQPSLNQPSPPLILAVGMADGTVSLQRLQDDSSLLPPTTAMTSPAASGLAAAAYHFDMGGADSNKKRQRRLGPSLVIQRPGRIRSCDFSTDGVHLAVAGDDCQCALYQLVFDDDSDSSSENELIRLDLVTELTRVDRVYAVQFSPDGRYLAVGGYDETVAIADSTTWEVISEIPTKGLVFALAWSPDSRYLAIGGSDKCCSMVDVDTSWHVFREIRRPSSVHTLTWHPTGRFLAIGASEVAIIQRDSLTVVQEIDFRPKQKNERGRRSSTQSLYKVNAACWSPNGSYLVVCGSDMCRLVETKTFQPVHEIKGSSCSAVWGQQKVLSGLPRRYLVLGGGEEDRKVIILKAGLEVSGGASSVGDDLSSFASTSHFSHRSNNSEWVLKENAFRDVEEVTATETESPVGSDVKRHSSTVKVTAIAFSRGSKSRPSTCFAHAEDDGRVTIRSSGRWKLMKEFDVPEEKFIHSLSFSRGGRFLAMGSRGFTVFVAMYPDWSIVMETTLESEVSCVTFSKNNERLAVGTSDGIVTLLDPRNDWNAAAEINNSESSVLSMDWSSKILAVGRLDGTVSVYETEQVLNNFCVPVAELAHKTSARAVGLGVGSRILAVGTDDGSVNLYIAKGNWVLCHQVRADVGVTCIQWSPTGRFMAYGGQGGLFKVIDTIFWTEVDEARVPSKTGNGSEDCISSIAFSQDGKLIACSGPSSGTNVLDSSTWETTFSMMTRQSAIPEESYPCDTSISSTEDCEV